MKAMILVGAVLLLSGCSLLDDKHIAYGTMPETKVYVMDQKDLERIWAKIPDAYGACPRAFTWHHKIYLESTGNDSQAMFERLWGHEAMHNWRGRHGETLEHSGNCANPVWDLTPLFTQYRP